MALRRVRSTFSLYQFSHTFLANQERHRSKLVGHLSNEKEKCRRPTTVVIFTVLFTLSGAAYAQSPGSSAGATAGGSSASGGDNASSTTVGSSMNGSTDRQQRQHGGTLSLQQLEK
jgi:hypothetical protein